MKNDEFRNLREHIFACLHFLNSEKVSNVNIQFEYIERSHAVLNSFTEECKMNMREYNYNAEILIPHFDEYYRKVDGWNKEFMYETDNERFKSNRLVDTISDIFKSVFYFLDSFVSDLIKPKTKTQSFRAKVEKEYLRDAYEQLNSLKFIINNKDPKSFVNVFSGISPDNKVGWIGGYGTIKYFICELLNNECIEFVNNQWQITANCFYNGKSSKPFDPSKIQHGHITIDKAKIADINKVISTFTDNIEKKKN